MDKRKLEYVERTRAVLMSGLVTRITWDGGVRSPCGGTSFSLAVRPLPCTLRELKARYGVAPSRCAKRW